MINPEILQRYINDFRRHFSPFLRPSIGLSCIAYPAKGLGAVLEFTIGPNVANEDRIKQPTETVNDALTKLNQHAFGGDLRGFLFGGTNVIMEDNRIILIKGDDAPLSWTDEAARDDVRNLSARTIRDAEPVPTVVAR